MVCLIPATCPRDYYEYLTGAWTPASYADSGWCFQVRQSPPLPWHSCEDSSPANQTNTHTHTHTPEIKMKQVYALMIPRGNTAAHIRLSMPKYVPPKCLFQWRSWPAPNSWFFRLTGVNTPNGTSMGPAVIFVGSWLSPTDTQTTDISKTVSWI